MLPSWTVTDAMKNRKDYHHGSMLLPVVFCKFCLIIITLSSTSNARPVYVKQEGKDEEEAGAQGAQSYWESMWRNDNDDGHFYGVPGFFLYPLPNSFYGGASSISTEASFLWIAILTTGTFVLQTLL